MKKILYAVMLLLGLSMMVSCSVSPEEQAFLDAYNVKETVVITPDNYLNWLT